MYVIMYNPRIVAASVSSGCPRRRYQASGVRLYWIVDLDARVVEEWRSGTDQPAVIDHVLRWQPDPAFLN
jgi:hypothetical protein